MSQTESRTVLVELPQGRERLSTGDWPCLMMSQADRRPWCQVRSGNWDRWEHLPLGRMDAEPNGCSDGFLLEQDGGPYGCGGLGRDWEIPACSHMVAWRTMIRFVPVTTGRAGVHTVLVVAETSCLRRLAG